MLVSYNQTLTLDPAWLTPTVRSLARAAAGAPCQPTLWASGEPLPNPDYFPADRSVWPVLADALEEAGCDRSDLLDRLRGQESCVGHWHAVEVVNKIAWLTGAQVARDWAAQQEWAAKWAATRQRLRHEAERKRVEEQARVDEHRELIAPKLRRLAEQKGYWYRQFESLLSQPGYVRCEFHDLRGTPPAGTIWIRKSTSGKYGKSRRDKYGPPMTADEVRAYIASRQGVVA